MDMGVADEYGGDMKSIHKWPVLLMLWPLFTACATTLKPADWNFEKNAVRIHIKADNQLNLFNGKAHTLYICFYQLAELNAFDQLTQDASGIRRLLECRLFDDSVASANSRVIHAGENITVMLDRSEQARYLAIVAGYSTELTDARMVRRHKFQTYKKRESLFKQKYRCIPCPAAIELSLGPNQIEHSKTLQSELKCSDECE